MSLEITKWIDWDKHYVLFGKDLQSWIAGFGDTENEAIIDFLKIYISAKVIKDFNYNDEYWEYWSYDDSFEYWESCGRQNAYSNINNIMNILVN